MFYLMYQSWSDLLALQCYTAAQVSGALDTLQRRPGPDLMRPFLEELAQKSDTAISCYPNARLPNPLSATGFDLLPEDMAVSWPWKAQGPPIAPVQIRGEERKTGAGHPSQEGSAWSVVARFIADVWWCGDARIADRAKVELVIPDRGSVDGHHVVGIDDRSALGQPRV